MIYILHESKKKQTDLRISPVPRRERDLLWFYYVHRCVFGSNNFLTDTFTLSLSLSTTPDEILSMVKSLASPPHRILLWLDAVREIDSSFRRTIIVVSKFDNRLKEFNDRGEVDRYLSASRYLGENTRPYFVALPKDRSTVSNDEFRRHGRYKAFA
ncbi:BnaAnng03430D [Brassica napus]|uniref:BnaAnng03430D protein n=2 Tax=Brassica TaxID=3705 RepID=A0A078GW35_BRANA|nr:BnaAnng03430D [Brassica napus]VDC76106.1 unnamed protein product [Brassica rapa]